MSIQEKKSAKGNPYGILKLSDQKGEFELFLFAEILVNNREKLKESESVVLTLHKETQTGELSQRRRVNVRKILSLDQMIKSPYKKITIELKENCNIKEIKEILSSNGSTQIQLIINSQNQKALYSLQKNRKIDLELLKTLKSKEYVAKITV